MWGESFQTRPIYGGHDDRYSKANSPEPPTEISSDDTAMAGEPTTRTRLDDPTLLTTSSLDALQTTDQRKVLDIVDKLRRTGLSSVLQLPQLVVCGHQSSGKSSVLEAITEIPFPRKENLCTRFATEIVLRRDPISSISTKITPDKNRPSHEQEHLRDFSKSIKDFTELPALIDEATTVMGLDGASGTRAFARDVLSIEICGPGRPQLTLVDLPGLIHSENKSQTKADVQLIRSLVEEYISNERTIILAVISAKNDYANQIILQDCRRVDIKGSRTLGIITKPDFLRPGSDNERDWLDLAQNRDVYFELGWHMLKNRADGELSTSFEERNTSESLFFSKGRYRELPQDMVGIESLRARLSRMLHNHLTEELPDLKRELGVKLTEATGELSRLGQKRSTVSEQRQFLMGLSVTVHDILRSAVQGHYEHPFFGPVDTDAAVDQNSNVQRLRAVIQYLNLRFAEDMRRRGHKFSLSKTKEVSDSQNSGNNDNGRGSAGPAVVDDGMEEDSSTESDNEDSRTLHKAQQGLPHEVHAPKRITRSEAVDWVLHILQRSRGRELPGNFNPMLISQLFWEQSEPWEALALAHIKRVASTCDTFVKSVLSYVATPEIESRLLTLKIEAALKEALDAAVAELKRIVDDKKRHPITYNHYYTTNMQKLRHKKYNKVVKQVSRNSRVLAFTGDFGASKKEYIDPEVFEKSLSGHIQQNMDKFSAEEALDSQMAYYKDELKYFVGVVTKQVIERHLVDTLPSQIISPMVIAGLTEEEVNYVAAEPAEVTQQRNFLEARKKMLESGQEMFRLAMGGLR